MTHTRKGPSPISGVVSRLASLAPQPPRPASFARASTTGGPASSAPRRLRLRSRLRSLPLPPPPATANLAQLWGSLSVFPRTNLPHDPVDDGGNSGGTKIMLGESSCATPVAEGIELLPRPPGNRGSGATRRRGSTRGFAPACWRTHRGGEVTTSAGAGVEENVDRERHRYWSKEGPLGLILSRALRLFPVTSTYHTNRLHRSVTTRTCWSWRCTRSSHAVVDAVSPRLIWRPYGDRGIGEPACAPAR